MKSLKESILANIETSLNNADANINELISFGGKLKLLEIFGHDESALYGINTSTIAKNISGLKPYSKDVEDIIDRYNSRYCMSNMSNRTRKNIEAFITYIENVKINDDNIDFNDHKTKTEFLAEITSMMKDDKSLSSKAKVHYETHFGGDKRGIFKISLNYNFNDLTFLYEIK